MDSLGEAFAAFIARHGYGSGRSDVDFGSAHPQACRRGGRRAVEGREERRGHGKGNQNPIESQALSVGLGWKGNDAVTAGRLWFVHVVGSIDGPTVFRLLAPGR